MNFLQTLGQVSRVDREEFLVRSVFRKRALHIGCVDKGLLDERLRTGTLMHERLAESSEELWGLDTDEQGLDKLRQLGFANLIAGSAESPPESLLRERFEVIVAGEVIEHVRNPGNFLDAVERLMAPGGRLIITTPNAMRYYNPIPSLFRRELVHPDHLAWYSPYTLIATLHAGGLSVQAVHVYVKAPLAGVRGEMPLARASARRLYNTVVSGVHEIVVSLFPYAADGLVVIAASGASSERTSCQT